MYIPIYFESAATSLASRKSSISLKLTDVGTGAVVGGGADFWALLDLCVVPESFVPVALDLSVVPESFVPVAEVIIININASKPKPIKIAPQVLSCFLKKYQAPKIHPSGKNRNDTIDNIILPNIYRKPHSI